MRRSSSERACAASLRGDVWALPNWLTVKDVYRGTTLDPRDLVSRGAPRAPMKNGAKKTVAHPASTHTSRLAYDDPKIPDKLDRPACA
jgi:hypothetical protein